MSALSTLPTVRKEPALTFTLPRSIITCIFCASRPSRSHSPALTLFHAVSRPVHHLRASCELGDPQGRPADPALRHHHRLGRRHARHGLHHQLAAACRVPHSPRVRSLRLTTSTGLDLMDTDESSRALPAASHPRSFFEAGFFPGCTLCVPSYTLFTLADADGRERSAASSRPGTRASRWPSAWPSSTSRRWSSLASPTSSDGACRSSTAPTVSRAGGAWSPSPSPADLSCSRAESDAFAPSRSWIFLLFGAITVGLGIISYFVIGSSARSSLCSDSPLTCSRPPRSRLPRPGQVPD